MNEKINEIYDDIKATRFDGQRAIAAGLVGIAYAISDLANAVREDHEHQVFVHLADKERPS